MILKIIDLILARYENIGDLKRHVQLLESLVGRYYKGINTNVVYHIIEVDYSSMVLNAVGVHVTDYEIYHTTCQLSVNSEEDLEKRNDFERITDEEGKMFFTKYMDFKEMCNTQFYNMVNENVYKRDKLNYEYVPYCEDIELEVNLDMDENTSISDILSEYDEYINDKVMSIYDNYSTCVNNLAGKVLLNYDDKEFIHFTSVYDIEDDFVSLKVKRIRYEKGEYSLGYYGLYDKMTVDEFLKFDKNECCVLYDSSMPFSFSGYDVTDVFDKDLFELGFNGYIESKALS